MPSNARDAAVIGAQTGRLPRTPWRVAVRCSYGFPQTIASPGKLDDGTPFPTSLWLTCPWLVDAAGAAESSGEGAVWSYRAAENPDLAEALLASDRALREFRAAESGGHDPCSAVGVAGQRDALKVKCLHAHVALAIQSLGDPIGEELVARVGRECPDGRCKRFADPEESS